MRKISQRVSINTADSFKHDVNTDSENDEDEIADRVYLDKDSDTSPLVRSRGITMTPVSENRKMQLNEVEKLI